MHRTSFQINFANDLRYQKVKINSVLEYLKNEIPDLGEDDLFDLRIMYSELISNAIIHGNKRDFAKKVEVCIEIDNSAIITTIRDEGGGFDYASLLEPTDMDEDVFSEHGRGLRIVLGLADAVEWNDDGNEIMFYKLLQNTLSA